MNYAIHADGLIKRYGEIKALDGVDLAVPTGSMLGVLGPNSACKTAAVHILATLPQPDSGHATVNGLDVAKQADDVRRLIGLAEAADRRIKTYSCGMRRRLDLAASLVGRPAVIFLDEPTTGLDPGKRGDVWAMSAN